MLHEVTYSPKNITQYREFLSTDEFNNLETEAAKYRGKSIVHINATPQGGGVAEILKSLVPLQQSLGLQSRWFVLKPDDRLFAITKKLHNSLQGSHEYLSAEEKDYYLQYNKDLARSIEELNPDSVIIHDPQPLASIAFFKHASANIRIHIDLTHPNPDSLEFIVPFIKEYSTAVFSLPAYVPQFLDEKKILISPPAIDPLSPKNTPLPPDSGRAILSGMGINPDRPIMTQVSRFDPWKDPTGVIDAYREVRNEMPDAQLVLAGLIEAQDDPEAISMVEMVAKHAENDPMIHLISNPADLKGVSNDIFINAIQTFSDVVLQKSTREGFGLTVTEAMWKRKAVIGGNVGGIKLQIKDGVNGFLVNSPAEAAKRSLELLRNKEQAHQMGEEARESVRKNFLITRLLFDEFKIMNHGA